MFKISLLLLSFPTFSLAVLHWKHENNVFRDFYFVSKGLIFLNDYFEKVKINKYFKSKNNV